MSVEYYLVCDRHRGFVHTCSDGLSGPLLQCDKSLAAFVISHRCCGLRVAQEDAEPKNYTEWTAENWQDLMSYDLVGG